MTAANLTRARADYLQTMLVQDAVIYRAADTVSDGMGGEIPNRSSGTAVKCRVMRMGTTAQVLDAGDSAHAEGNWDIALPAGANAIRPELNLGDVISVTGDAEYQVLSPGSPQAEALTEHYITKRIT